MNRRTERIGSVIRGIVARAIQRRLNDPRIEKLTSITRVEVSADLSVARVYVSVLAPEARQKLCVQALRSAAGRLRGLVAEQVVLRQVPRLDFILDDSVQRAFRTVQAIDQAMIELGEPAPWERPAAAPPADASRADSAPPAGDGEQTSAEQDD